MKPLSIFFHQSGAFTLAQLLDNYAEYDRNKTRGIPRQGETLARVQKKALLRCSIELSFIVPAATKFAPGLFGVAAALSLSPYWIYDRIYNGTIAPNAKGSKIFRLACDRLALLFSILGKKDSISIDRDETTIPTNLPDQKIHSVFAAANSVDRVSNATASLTCQCHWRIRNASFRRSHLAARSR